METKSAYVIFSDKKLESDFEKLKNGKFEDKELCNSITKAIGELKKEPTSGIKIPKNLWPKGYIQKYNIPNLWKYNLPNTWRLVYTIKTDEMKRIIVILEWFNHKEYERKFGY